MVLLERVTDLKLYGRDQDAPHAIGEGLADQFSWNYDHVASLWEHENWLPESAVKLARAHYAGFMVNRHDGLRVISLNTDMWYRYAEFSLFCALISFDMLLILNLKIELFQLYQYDDL